MSEKYNEYIEEHKHNVASAYKWLAEHMPNLFRDDNQKADIEYLCCYQHDDSKTNTDEYEAYDEYFYGNKSYEAVQEFNYAWLRHIHRNPHHWQYWILNNDNPDEGEIILEMPYRYIIEMICDWWSFSWKKGDLTEIFKWYKERKEYIKLGEETRKKVEDILEQLEERLAIVEADQ